MHNGLFAFVLAATVQASAIAEEAPMTPLRPDQVAYLALYKELVATNTTLSVGSCTLAAERLAAHLKAAGFTERDITLFSVPDHPKEGGLVAIGIPVYGVPGGWGDPDGNGTHGLDERRSVRSVFVGRDFLTDLVKLYADSD